MPIRRPSLTILLLLLLVLGTAFAAVRQVSQHIDRLLADTTAHAEQIAHTIAQVAHFEVAANDRVALAYRLEGFNHFENVLAVIVLDRREVLLAAAERNPAGNLTAIPQLPFEIRQHPTREHSNNPLIHAPKNLIVRADIGEIAPIGWVYVEYQPKSVSAHRTESLLNGLIILALLATMIMVGWRHFNISGMRR